MWRYKWYTSTSTLLPTQWSPHKRRQCIRCCLRVSSGCFPDVEVQVVHVYQYTPTYTMEPPQKATMYQMLLKSKLGMFPRCGGSSGTRLPVHSYLHNGAPQKATMYQMLIKSKLGMFPRCGGTSGTRLPVHSCLHNGAPTKGDNVSDVD